MKNLDDIESFGGTDADTDNLLDECFEDHDAYLVAKNHSKFLVIGRKGSGKTAIYRKMLTIRSHDVFSVGHTFADYPWHLHDKQEAIGVPDEERFVHSWRYLILMILSKILLNQDQSQPWNENNFEEMRRLEKFVVDTYGTRDPDIAQIFSSHKTLRFQSSFEIPLTQLRVSLGTNELPMDKLPTIIHEVNQNLTSAVVKSLNPLFNYYICFDQLDLGFERETEKYRNRLIGLLLAARDINLKAKQENKKLSVVIFLRDDIYQILRFEDKNKMTEGLMSRIEWDTSRTNKTLKQLMEKRFAKVLEIDEEDAWEKVFDETETMTGRQSKYQHMVDRTFLRPRDIIKFCNEVLSVYKGQSEGKRNLFSNRELQQARTLYSQYFLNELDDEVFKHIPRYEDYIEILKSLNSLQFNLEDFKKAYESRKTLSSEGRDTIQILKELFNFSLISYYSPGGGGYGGSEYIWHYQDSRSQFNETATSFRIHPGFKEVLGLKRYTKSE